MEEKRRRFEMEYFSKLLQGRSVPTQCVITRDLGTIRLHLQ